MLPASFSHLRRRTGRYRPRDLMSTFRLHSTATVLPSRYAACCSLYDIWSVWRSSCTFSVPSPAFVSFPAVFAKYMNRLWTCTLVTGIHWDEPACDGSQPVSRTWQRTQGTAVAQCVEPYRTIQYGSLIQCNLNYRIISAPPLVSIGDEQTRRGHRSLPEGCRAADTDPGWSSAVNGWNGHV